MTCKFSLKFQYIIKHKMESVHVYQPSIVILIKNQILQTDVWENVK